MSKSYTLRVGIHKGHYLVGKLKGRKITITRITDYYYFSQRVLKKLSQPITIVLQEVVFQPPSSTWKPTERQYRPSFYVWSSTHLTALSLGYVLPVRNGFRYILKDKCAQGEGLFHEWEEDTHPPVAHVIKEMRRMIQRMTQKEFELWLTRMSPNYDPKSEISKL